LNLLKHSEVVVWILALLLLAFANPEEHHFSLCPVSNLGFTWCPGCGVGRAISCILQGNILGSFKFHWFGIPALVILLYRIFTLSKKYLVYFKAQAHNHG
jgi:hypothetical protein